MITKYDANGSFLEEEDPWVESWRRKRGKGAQVRECRTPTGTRSEASWSTVDPSPSLCWTSRALVWR